MNRASLIGRWNEARAGERRPRCRPSFEALEVRDLPAVTAVFASPGVLVVVADSGEAIAIRDAGGFVLINESPPDSGPVPSAACLMVVYPDLILTALMMPRLDGIGLIRRVRRLP